jgi:hypothetical protein
MELKVGVGEGEVEVWSWSWIVSRRNDTRGTPEFVVTIPTTVLV